MDLLEPRWEATRPTLEEAAEMCRRVAVAPVESRLDAVENVLRYLRKSHSNGGALFAEFGIGNSAVFDWFASRNRLGEFSILHSLLHRKEVQDCIPELLMSGETVLTSGDCSISSIAGADGFSMESPFLLDGRIAQALYAGGTYGQSELESKSAEQLALAFWEELFGQRYSEIAVFSNFTPWTRWFHGIAWDWTAFVLDRRKRTFAFLAVTDTD